MPTFDRDHWRQQERSATGKMRRGAGLTVLGAATAIPAAMLIRGATVNPPKYLAWSLVMAMATTGMTAHGIGSVGFGRKQRAQARRFLADYDADASSVDARDEWAADLHDRKRTATKTTIFGGLLVVQGALLLTNGAVLARRGARGESIGGARPWPSFVVGGLSSSAGLAVVVVGAIRIRDLRRRSVAPRSPMTQALILPDLGGDAATGEQRVGVSVVAAF